MNRLFRDVDGDCASPRDSVVCIGAFDGLHLGHQALIGRAVARARVLGCDSAVLSFEPLPREFFAGAGAPPRLSLPRARIQNLAGLDVDIIGLLRFNRVLAAMPAEAFVRRVLVGRLAAREVWVGPDFRFGRGREGDLETLQRLGATLGFQACSLDIVESDGERISATRVRELLAAGELGRAAALLGRPYSITGRVVHGCRLGHQLGYPTANLRLSGKRPALKGVFASRVHGLGGTARHAVSSLGTRPTVDGVEPLLETHLFDFEGDLYGRRIEVEFVARLRDEEKFNDLPSLVAQMQCDAAAARRILNESDQRATA